MREAQCRMNARTRTVEGLARKRHQTVAIAQMVQRLHMRILHGQRTAAIKLNNLQRRGRHDTLQQRTRVWGAAQEQLVGPHRKDGVGPREAAVKRADHLHFIHNAHVKLRVDWHHLGRAADVRGVGIHNAVLTRQQRRANASCHQLIIDLVCQEPQRRRVTAAPRELQLLERRIRLARVGRPNVQRDALTRKTLSARVRSRSRPQTHGGAQLRMCRAHAQGTRIIVVTFAAGLKRCLIGWRGAALARDGPRVSQEQQTRSAPKTESEHRTSTHVNVPHCTLTLVGLLISDFVWLHERSV